MFDVDFTFMDDAQRDPFVARAAPRAISDGATSDAPPFQLRGLIRTAQTQRALLADADGRTHLVQPGDHLDSWTIVTITADGVVMQATGPGSQASVTIRLERGGIGPQPRREREERRK